MHGTGAWTMISPRREGSNGKLRFLDFSVCCTQAENTVRIKKPWAENLVSSKGHSFISCPLQYMARIYTHKVDRTKVLSPTFYFVAVFKCEPQHCP